MHTKFPRTFSLGHFTIDLSESTPWDSITKYQACGSFNRFHRNSERGGRNLVINSFVWHYERFQIQVSTWRFLANHHLEEMGRNCNIILANDFVANVIFAICFTSKITVKCLDKLYVESNEFVSKQSS